MVVTHTSGYPFGNIYSSDSRLLYFDFRLLLGNVEFEESWVKDRVERPEALGIAIISSMFISFPIAFVAMES